MSFFIDPIKNLNLYLKNLLPISKTTGNNESVFTQLLKNGNNNGYSLYKNVAPIGHAVDMIAEKVSQLQPVIVDRNGVVVADGGDDVYELLRKPNSVQRYAEFMMQLATDFLIYNNCYVHLSNNTNYKSKYITPVCDNSVSITESDGQRTYTVNITGFYSSINGVYIQRHDKNDGRIIGANGLGELIHIKGYLGQNETKATSKLLALAEDAEIVEKSLLQVKSFLDRGYSGSGILQTNFKKQEMFEAFKKDLANYYTGAQNEGRMMALNGTDVEVHMHNNRSNRDMQANENKQQSKMSIYQRYDIPEPLVNSGSQTYNNYQTALYALYENAVFPTFNAIFDAISDSFINRKLLKPENRITCDSSKVSAMKLREAEEVRMLKLANVLTVNEMRSRLGYEKLKDYGDEVYRPMSEIPISQDPYADQATKKEWVDQIKSLGGEYSDDYLNNIWNEYNGKE